MRQQTILLVEDEENDLELLMLAINKTGVTVKFFTVRDGDQAISYLEGTGHFTDRARFPLPKLMLLDLKLPKRSGLEVLIWMREQTRLDKIGVVVLTGSQRSLDVHWAYEMGADLYLVKPVDVRLLKQVLSAGNRRRLDSMRKRIVEQMAQIAPLPAAALGGE